MDKDKNYPPPQKGGQNDPYRNTPEINEELVHSGALVPKKPLNKAIVQEKPSVEPVGVDVKPPLNLPSGKPENIPEFKENYKKSEIKDIKEKPLGKPQKEKEIISKKNKEQEGLSKAVENTKLFGADVLENKIKKEEKKEIDGLRTYEDDIAKIIRNKKASVADIRAAEVKKHEKEPYVPVKQSSKKSKRLNWNKIFVGLLAFLFLVSAVTIIFKVSFSGKSKEVKQFEKTVVSEGEFFFVDNQIEVRTDGLNSRELRNKLIAQKGETVGSLSEISHIYFTNKSDTGRRLLNIKEFLDLLDTNAPGELVRNLEDDFMYGIHVFDGNQPFLVLKTSSYGNAFSGMLAWEDNIENDFKDILVMKVEKNIDDATTTTKSFLNLKHTFKDRVVLNRDVRLIEDDDGKVLFMYAFINTDTIVLTTNESTLKEIIDRLARIRFNR